MITEITIKIPTSEQTTVDEDGLQVSGPPPTDESVFVSDFSTGESAPPGPEELQSSAAEIFAYSNVPSPLDEADSASLDTSTALGPLSSDVCHTEALSENTPAPGLDVAQKESAAPAPEIDD